MIREMVTIDEERCDGCGLCVPACEEGALRIVDGKARLVADRLCDGMGACLGHCPKGAIKIERREADAFDEQAVHAHLDGEPHPCPSTVAAQRHPGGAALPVMTPAASPAPASTSSSAAPAHGGCPGSRFLAFQQSPPAPQAGAPTPSQLRHWPVQLRLLSPQAPALKGAKLLICADCVPFACADFHSALLADHAVAVACPKLDDPRGYVEKLAAMMAHNDLPQITVARMEVPCCMGLVAMVMQARAQAAVDTPVEEVVVGVQGNIQLRRRIG